MESSRRRIRGRKSPWQAVVREVAEEIGLNVKVKEIAGIYYKPLQNEIVFSFICTVEGGQATTSNEADDIQFFNCRQLPKNIALKQKERILDALKNNKKIILKIQKGTDTIKK
jgi:NADH pyrophosphatase NudC (nudix superfamily)